MSRARNELRTYSRRRHLESEDSSGWPARKRPAGCLFEFVDVKQEVEDSWDLSADIGEQCDICRKHFVSQNELKTHLKLCAREAVTGSNASLSLITPGQVKEEAVAADYDTDLAVSQISKTDSNEQPTSEAVEASSSEERPAKGGGYRKITDARKLFPSRGAVTTVADDLPKFIIGLDQLEEHYSEATRSFIAIMERSMFAQDLGRVEAVVEEEEDDDREEAAVAECRNCRRTFSSAERYTRHQHAHTFVKVQPEDQPTICSMCGQEFR